MGIFAVHAIWLGNGNASQGGLLILPYAYRAAWCMRAHLVGWGGPLGRTGKRLGDQSVGWCEKELFPRSNEKRALFVVSTLFLTPSFLEMGLRATFAHS